MKRILNYINWPFLLISCLALSTTVTAQRFTRGDTLRGTLSELRACYDVTFYDLDIRINPYDSTIAGSNLIVFEAQQDFNKLQIDLFENMDIHNITYHGDSLIFTREYDAVFVNFREPILKGSIDSIRVYYSGKPTIAARAPWDGGFVWEEDSEGRPWVGVACEGDGASLWWPCKDHLSDEPDSMRISTTIPKGLVNVSNGRLEYIDISDNRWTRMDWFVANPINTYNVTVNIAQYEQFSDSYISVVDGDTLTLDYYVLPENLEKAKAQFAQVKPMMACFEQYMGKYPFYEDGYKLVETPYLGMEHQSAIAYGNQYLNGYAGMDYSRIGLMFDYIIIHETGHEWWGNNVSMQDLADMWIHEGFCTYSEAIYVECLFGKDTAMNYVNAKRPMVENAEPIIGVYNVNQEGAGDMYNKGMLMLNTLRTIIDNDELWWKIIKGIQEEFGKSTTNTEEIVGYINKMAGKDYTPFFDQYLRHAKIPVYEYRLVKNGKVHILRHRWKTDVKDFEMPVVLSTGKDNMKKVNVTTEWQEMTINIKKEKDFKLAIDNLYVKVDDGEK